MRIVLFFLIIIIKPVVGMKNYKDMHILHTKNMSETGKQDYRYYDELIDNECRSLIATFKGNMKLTEKQENFFKDLYTINSNWVTVPAYIRFLIENDISIKKNINNDDVKKIEEYLTDLSHKLNERIRLQTMASQKNKETRHE